MSIQSKHFLNSAETIVVESLKGLCDVNPQLALDPDNKREGMLTAAVCGNIFASPNASQVRRGIDLVDNTKGTIIIVKNYTGDILNFGLAKEQYAANHPDKAENARFVIVGDDVAVGKSQGKIVGRRGLAGTVLVYKIAGALAHRGASLDDVHNVAVWTSQNVATIGASLGHVHVPGTESLRTNLSETELEIGLGIHNEQGNNRISPIPSLSGLTKQLLDYLTSQNDPERSFLQLKKGDSLVLMVNNLGSVSELELSGIVAEARKQLNERGFRISRILSGTFMTSLNMPGFSLTLLRLPSEGDAPSFKASDILGLLDDKPKVPGWKWTPSSEPLLRDEQQVEGKSVSVAHDNVLQLKAKDPNSFVSAIRDASNQLIAAESEITRMDTIAGDGDAGLTLKAGAQGVLASLDKGTIHGENIVASLIAIGQVAEEVMGGTSGALYSIFFSALAQGFQSQSIPAGSVVTPQQWQVALTSALDKLYTYTRARPPSRTLVDPLAAFIDEVRKNRGQDFASAVRLAAQATEATKDLEAKAGRSAYVQSEQLQKEQVPDPGAWGVKTILESLGI
ncbi:hypothetical protein EST38_g4183 [Candolleomyces aberdarensis]|uniref:Dihydroxyacetone kinase n=1 Tax=Candolleomyces aberdarensis TaxID=2316362 RepID=A0A4Q2DNP0_9AGAR|nr:hypothetical protein EST38_g4183 [Candolleomyces aberdarensis]